MINLSMMKTFAPLLLFLMLVSCVSTQGKTSSEAVTPTEAAPGTATATPTATKIPTVIPLGGIPTAINTPHISPTLIGEMSWEQAFEVNDQRAPTFEGALSFNLRIVNVSLILWGDSDTLFQVYAKGEITNDSDHPIVVRRNISNGFTLNADVSWKIAYDKGELPHFICCVDVFGGMVLTPQDFVLLQPGESQNYSLPFILPTSLEDTEGKSIELAGKLITFTATYVNHNIGYDKTVSFNDPDYRYIDMNAWVGRVDSNSAEYLFPE